MRGHLHATFKLALREGWVAANPVKGSECPAQPRSTGIRFLEPEQVDAVVRSVPEDAWGKVERDLYRVAAWTGLRQGELFELRGRDVDLAAQVVRAERNVLGGRGVRNEGSRRGAACLSARAGVDVNTLRAWLGHTALATTMAYCTAPPSPARRRCWAARSRGRR